MLTSRSLILLRLRSHQPDPRFTVTCGIRFAYLHAATGLSHQGSPSLQLQLFKPDTEGGICPDGMPPGSCEQSRSIRRSDPSRHTAGVYVWCNLYHVLLPPYRRHIAARRWHHRCARRRGRAIDDSSWRVPSNAVSITCATGSTKRTPRLGDGSPEKDRKATAPKKRASGANAPLAPLQPTRLIWPFP